MLSKYHGQITIDILLTWQNGRIKQEYIPFAIAIGEYTGTTPARPLFLQNKTKGSVLVSVS